MSALADAPPAHEADDNPSADDILENRPGWEIEAKTEEEARQQLASTVLRPERNAARITEAYNPRSGLEIMRVANELRKHADSAKSGDLSNLEAMLMNQAQSLDSIFTDLALRAKRNGEYLDSMNVLLSLALRAQNQCRNTLQALAEMKLPKSQPIMQQLVKNGEIRSENANAAKELMDEPETQQKRLDRGTKSETGPGNPSLEPVATLHRAANGRR